MVTNDLISPEVWAYTPGNGELKWGKVMATNKKISLASVGRYAG